MFLGARCRLDGSARDALAAITIVLGDDESIRAALR